MKLLLVVLSFTLATSSWALSEVERKELFAGALQRLKATEIEKRAPKVGERFPDLEVAGKKISAWTKEAPLVLTFYRGGWCPYCVKQLKEMNSELEQFKEAQIIAVSPENPEEVLKTKRKNTLKLILFSDKDNELARMLGLAFKVEDPIVAEYKNFGIDLAKTQGNSEHVLPVPATFVIDQSMKVAFVFVDADYSQRAKTSDVIKSVQRLMAPRGE